MKRLLLLALGCAIYSLAIAQLDPTLQVEEMPGVTDFTDDPDARPTVDGSFGLYLYMLDGRSEFGNNLDRSNFGFHFDWAGEHTPTRLRAGVQFGMAFLGSRHRDFEVPVAGFIKEYRETTSTNLLDLAVPIGYHPATRSRLSPYLQFKTGIRWMHTSTTLADLNDNTEDPYSETDVVQSRAAWLYGGAVGLEYRITDCVSLDARAEYTGTPSMSYMLPTERAPGEPPVTEFERFTSPVDAVAISVGVRFTFSGCATCSDEAPICDGTCNCPYHNEDAEYRRPNTKKKERRTPKKRRTPRKSRTPKVDRDQTPDIDG